MMLSGKLVRYASIFALVITPRAAAQSPPPPGTLVDLGGYRLHVWCTGKGSNTVVLFSGAGDYSFDWERIQVPLAKTTRVCSFDRAGYAWSSLGPVPRTMHQEAAEVRWALAKLNVRPPYVLVGHSLGGLVVREYAFRFPDDVAGLVLIDPTHEDTKLMYQGKIVRVRDSARQIEVPGPQTYASSPPQPLTREQEREFADYRAFLGAPQIKPPFDRLSRHRQNWRLWALGTMRAVPDDGYWAEELDAMARRRQPNELRGMPVVIVLPLQRPFPQNMPEEERGIFDEKVRQKEGLLSLSSRSELLRADSAGHHVHLEQPEVVVTGIYRILRRLR